MQLRQLVRMKFSLILLAFVGLVLIVGANDEKITDEEISELITDYKALYSDGAGMTGNVSDLFILGLVIKKI